MRNRKGFTLIELIVVIAILGILAGIAIPRLSGFQEKAKISADVATLATIERSIAIGVADGSLIPEPSKTTGTVIATANANGAITFSGTAVKASDTVSGVMSTLIGDNPVFKKSSHAGIVITWTIADDGKITKVVTVKSWE
ncbi:prepilin-type N-terminal cleavage/methylation domain-containing protein [Lutibacter sp. B2]|nr:prepilin-type N-terminal cleavage/methylation domain-containing protein [Lutibacter sp. B2]